MLKTAKVFRSGNSQAVRLPKGFQTEETEFNIKRIGDSLLLTPKDNPWEVFDEGLAQFTDDFMTSGRNQPPIQERGEL